MPIRLDRRTPDFSERFRAFLATKREASADVEAVVRAIIADVAARGDRALIELSRKLDRVDLEQTSLRVRADEIDAAYAVCDRRALDALTLARDRIEAYHRRQLPTDDRFADSLGVEFASRWRAIEAVGLYVPGGTAAYPSSVLMNAVPAKVAGVARLVMAVPASVAPRRWPRSPMAPRPSRRSPRSSARAMPMWRRPSASSSARSAST